MADDAPDLRTAVQGADLVVLPLRSLEGGWIEAGGDRLEAALLPVLAGRDATVISGALPEELELWAGTLGVRWENILEQEAFQLANAAVTAEGAVAVALEALDRTLSGANVLVIGWGRIGKLLAAKLRALGAVVTVCGRRGKQLAEIEVSGFLPEETGVYRRGLSSYDLIINTVPATVLEASQAEKTGEACVLLELASPPGGFTSEVRWMRPVVTARGLPGVTAPKTAGRILADAVWRCIAGEECGLE